MKKFKELKESKYGDAMTSRLPAHLDDPRVEPKPKVAKKPVKRNPKDHSWKLYRESAALDAAMDGIAILIAEELTPRERISGSERLKEKKKPDVDAYKQNSYAANTGEFSYKKLSQDRATHPEKFVAGLKESFSGSLQQAVAHAKQHGHKVTYGTNSRKWHSIDSSDRDFKSPFAYDPHDEKAVKKAAKFWVPKSLKETYEMAYDESGSDYKVGDKVVPKIGPHKGQVHTVIHVHPTGHLNIKPEVHVSRNRYHLGAAKADPKDVTRHVQEMVKPSETYLKAKEQRKLHFANKGTMRVINRKTVQEVFQAAKDKKKVDFLQKDGADESDKQTPASEPKVTQDGGESKPEKQSNRLKPEPAGKSKKLDVKGPGPEDKFQADPIVTPLTTMPDTASPKSGSQGVR